jgi:nucleotide-binding universal stress UspA family protein
MPLLPAYTVAFGAGITLATLTSEVTMIDLATVLVATDFGASSDNALRYGRTLARTFGGALHVLHVVDDVLARGLEAESAEFWADAQRQAEQDAAARLAERVTPDDMRRFGDRSVAVVSGNPAEAIVAYAREAGASLIVMGTRGAKALDRSGLGSVADRVVHAAPCPVLTIQAPDVALGTPGMAATAGSSA